MCHLMYCIRRCIGSITYEAFSLKTKQNKTQPKSNQCFRPNLLFTGNIRDREGKLNGTVKKQLDKTRVLDILQVNYAGLFEKLVL